jgi:hypothetical protein
MSLQGANLNNPGPKWLCHFLPGVRTKIWQVPARGPTINKLAHCRDPVFLSSLPRVYTDGSHGPQRPNDKL